MSSQAKVSAVAACAWAVKGNLLAILIGSDRIRNGWQSLFSLFQRQVSHYRIQIDRFLLPQKV